MRSILPMQAESHPYTDLGILCCEQNTRLPNPMEAHPQPSPTAEPVEEAELLENLGEFPGRTDQGDRMLMPMTKSRAREYLRGD